MIASLRPAPAHLRYLAPLLGLAFALPASVHAQAPLPMACPSGRISQIVIENGPVFLPHDDDPRLLKWAFGAANLLHVRTTESFLRRELLFAEGDCYDEFLISESRRLLEEYGFLAQVDAEAEQDASGDWIVRVRTRDEWSTQVDLGVTYDAGLKLERLQATEKNFLGQGIRGEVTHHQRREERTRSFSLSTPRLFGRTDAGISFGTSRGGSFFSQGLNHRFIGETSYWSGSQSYGRGTGFFTYATGGTGDYSHILVPVRSEAFEIAAGRRWGDPGRSTIFGVNFRREVRRVRAGIEFVENEDFDGSIPGTAEVPASVARQLSDWGATRVGLHLGTRRYRYREYEGLDALREVQTVGIGFWAGLSVGRSFPVLLPDDVRQERETYGRLHASFGHAVGSSLLHGGTTVEAAYSDGSWGNLIADLELVGYGRAKWLPMQTWFFRMSTGGGWRTTVPMQLALGGRDGVRSLRDDRLPGGRRLLFILEDRVRLDVIDLSIADLGFTVFGDAGRIWAGDVPFGVDSGWYGSVGFGLRLGIPSGTRNVWRPDIVFPLGREGSPVFRVTFELNRFRNGFSTARLGRSRRFNRGAEAY